MDEFLSSKKFIVSIIIFFAFVLGIGLFLSGLKIIESGEVGIKTTLGKYDNNELSPGAHLVIPIIQGIITVDTKVHSIHYKGKKDLPDKKGVIYKPAINVLDERGLPISVELTVQYRINPSEASELIQKWGFNWEDKLVNPVIRDVVRDVIGQYPAEKLPVKRQEIGIRIENKIRENMRKVSEGRVIVVGVQLRNIDLPPTVAKKIEEVQIAKQEAEKMKYIEEKAKKEQEVRKIKAETEKMEKVIKAEAEAEKRIKEAEGRAKAKLLEAKAQAEANKLIAKSITENILKWKELEVQKSFADAIKENKNMTLFLGTDNKNFHLWMNK